MSRRLHLDRIEVFLILAIMFLVSTLMFTLGVMVGMGVPVNPGAKQIVAGHSGTSHSPPSATSNNHDSSDVRSPASDETNFSKKKVAGADLKKAFRDSKQRALVDLTLRDQETNTPKSIDDAKAHFEAHGDKNRSPSSEVKKTEVTKRIPPKAADTVTVKSLFERKPASKDRFQPLSGQFTVQIGSYATADESDAKVVELRKNGFNDAYVQEVKTKKGDTWYRVGIGSFSKSPWAKQLGERVIKRKIASDYFVRQVE